MGFNYTFGVLFNDFTVFEQYKSLSMDAFNHNNQLLHAVFYQCLSLSLNAKQIDLQTLSVSDQSITPSPIVATEYKVMITLTKQCLSASSSASASESNSD